MIDFGPSDPFAALIAEQLKLEQRVGITETKETPLFENGVWTPTYQGTTIPGVTTYTTQVGNYAKIGKLVFAQFEITWTAATGTGFVRIMGLPFASLAGSRTAFAAQTNNVTFANGSIEGLIQGSTASSQLFSPLTNAAATELVMEAAGTIRGMIICFTA